MLKPRKCASKDCEQEFTPRVRTQRYHSATCASREASRRRNKKIKALLSREAQIQAAATA